MPLSLAAIKYRNVLAAYGGPVERIQVGEVSVRGIRMYQANARLKAGLTPHRASALYSTDDGTGTNLNASTAKHIAISEAMERWCYHTVHKSELAALYGFDIDPSTNGMASFPGFRARDARRSAMLEAIERFCIIGWWDGRLKATLRDTDWPDVHALEIPGPFGGVAVIAWTRTTCGSYAYGYAAEESFGAACERALMEMSRHENILFSWWLTSKSGVKRATPHLFDRRSLFFASEQGHELFLQRANATPTGPETKADVICDDEIPGPWSDYATVWRFALRPPSHHFLSQEVRYFFF